MAGLPDQPSPGEQPASHPHRSFLSDLRTVLASSGFRKLFATRLISQAGDGMFTAGLGTYVFFNAQSFPDPAAAALAFAVLYLPYSVVGPFAGVFIDRWSRRQILIVSALARGLCVALTALLIGTGTLGLPVYAGALLVLGVNRFFLSALSAALPHVVPADELVMANAVGPTSGTIVAFAGGITGIGLHLATGGGETGSAATLLTAGLCYLIASLVPLRLRRDQLGPDTEERRQVRGGITAGIGAVAAGLVAGARHAWQRRPAVAALVAIGGHRLLYGILLLMSILLYRNDFYPQSSNTALSHYLAVVVSSAVGYGTAAVLTPIATRRLSKQAWIAAMLAGAGLLTAAFGLGFTQPGFVLVGLELGIAAQGLAICATTILQLSVDDDFRGRVFSFYDLMFNVTFVIGTAAAAAFMPLTGRSVPMLVGAAAGYLAAAAGYLAVSRQPSAPGGAGGSPASAAQRSSS